MDEKEKIGHLLELYKIQMEHFERTRDIEFKVNIAFWTLIALAGKFGYDHGILKTYSDWGYLIFAGLTIGMHSFWMILIQLSEEKDLNIRKQYKSKIHEMVEEMAMDFLRSRVHCFITHRLGIILFLPQQKCLCL